MENKQNKESQVVEAIINQLSVVADTNPRGVLDVLQNDSFKAMFFSQYGNYYKEHLNGLEAFIINELG